MGVERGQKQYKGRSPKAPARHNTSVLLLLALEAGYEHLLGLLGGCQIALEHGAEEVRQLLIARESLEVGFRPCGGGARSSTGRPP
jgi:hypothetical protein